ncbi:IclR family transcriptional regulator [Oceanobacillus luteolus]|uniref:IclR family transcriptional regulator n=1 Tax=Oceanobacillus luteolus TaxID=1274358 RepID=A0ABW4HWX9_9BACI
MSQSLLRAIKLLDCFNDKAELSLLELVEISNMPKTTVFRLVTSLVEAGLLVKVPYSTHDVRYKLGLKLLQLGMRVMNQLEYREIALPYMKEINAKLNESVHLAVIEEDEAVYVEKLDSNKPVRLVIKIGARAPLYAGSAPKVLLAHTKETKRNEYLQQLELKKIAPNTIVDRDKLIQELTKIQKQGYAFSREEFFKDTIGYSCPIFDGAGQLVAALGISMPVIEFSDEKGNEILNELINAAKMISSELGYRN